MKNDAGRLMEPIVGSSWFERQSHFFTRVQTDALYGAGGFNGGLFHTFSLLRAQRYKMIKG